MPEFGYSAIDAAGRAVHGRQRAPTVEAARARLVARSLQPTSMQPLAGDEGARQSARPMTAAERVTFTRQFATLISVSPVAEALAALAQGNSARRIAAAAGSLSSAVQAGRPLAAAMAEQPDAFPPLYRGTVAAGEQTGALAQVMARLADLLERQADVRSRIQAALVYPLVLGIVALVIVAGLLAFVVPRIVEQFETLGQTLPLLTRLVIGLSDGLRQFGLVGLALLLAAGFGLKRLLRDPALRLAFDRRLLRLPLAGRLLREIDSARLARTLSTLIGNGMPLIDALRLTEATLSNRAMQAACGQMIETVREGGSLAGAMRRTGLFPSQLVHMTAAGESSSALEPMLLTAASYQERDFDRLMRSALSLLEPMIIVVMGVIVALIVLAILLPILQLNTLASL